MNYIEANLGKDERVILHARVSWMSQFWWFIFGIVLLPFYGIGLFFILAAILHVKCTECALTDKRVVAKFGFIRRETIEINLKRVESIQVKQGIWARICNYGSISVGGTGGKLAPIPYIVYPLDFKRKVLELTDNEG